MGQPIRSPLLESVAHGFSDADGLRPEDVCPGAREVRVKQVHSARVLTVHAPFGEERPEADGLVTATPGLVLSIVTADCAPVLMADRQAGVVAAVHAGWRGAVDGIGGEAVAAMEALGARRSRIRAAIGPCIHQPSYQVDAGLKDRFADLPDTDRFFLPEEPGHWRFDLPGFVAARLAEAGIAASEILPHDTYREQAGGQNRFHSYRRATHRGTPTSGRQVSMIALG